MDEHFDGSDAQLLVTCPKCGRQWLPPCEQTICIERHGECIPCRFVPVGGEINKHGSGEGTTEEIDAISAAAKLGAGETATKSLCDMTEADFDAVHNAGNKRCEASD